MKGVIKNMIDESYEKMVANVEISEILQLNIKKYAQRNYHRVFEETPNQYTANMMMLAKVIKSTTGTEPHMEDLINDYLLYEGVEYSTLPSELYQIALGILDGIDMRPYLVAFTARELREIRLLLKDMPDTIKKTKFSWEQMSVILQGLEDYNNL